MGKDDASILDGDDEFDTLYVLLEICGFDFEKYERIEEEIDKKLYDTGGYTKLAEDDYYNILLNEYPELLPTRENLNAQLLDPNSELNNLLSRCEIGYLDFLILGVLILKTGAIIPPELKAKILKTAAWETDEWRWKGLPKLFKEQRKEILKDFRSKSKTI